MRRLIFLLLPCTALGAADRPDLVVADFEADDYAGWTATGTAFGKGPARGTLPGQMHVEGFEGHGLVNSFNGGDDATGTLTSPPFRIERRHLNFLIGGGKYPGETCLDLLVAGSVVRTATGPNDRPGGSERLDWASWDVAEFEGKEAVLRITDARKGGWGHINVDQIVQSDRRRGVVPARRETSSSSARYLHLPVRERRPDPPGPAHGRRAARSTSSTSSWPRAAPTSGSSATWTPSARPAAPGRDVAAESVRRRSTRIDVADDLPDAADLYRETRPPAVPLHLPARLAQRPERPGLSSTANITSSTSTTPTAGTGATCTGATPSAPTSSTGPSCPRPSRRGPTATGLSPAARWSTATTRQGSARPEQPPARPGLHEHRPRRVHRLQPRPRPDVDRVRRQPGRQARGPRPAAALARADEALGDGRLRRDRRAAARSRSTPRPT